jgi:hypothetical protein
MQFRSMLLIGIVLLAGQGNGFAQTQTKPAPKPATKPAPIAPAAPLKDGWEEIDKRLVFLMVRLANVEASLDAVEKSLGLGTRQQAARVGDAKRAEQGNEMMDRKGGGPVKWSQFYGRTAEKFFYHPTDRNTTYHTTTILSQQSPSGDNSPGAGVPSRQGLPVHQRPPQLVNCKHVLVYWLQAQPHSNLNNLLSGCDKLIVHLPNGIALKSQF